MERKEGMKLNKYLTASIIAMLFLGLATVIPVHALDQKVFITTSTTSIQSTINDNTGTTPVGSTFIVYLMYSNFTDLAGIQYYLTWNNTILNFVSIVDTLPWPGANTFVGQNDTSTPGLMKFTAIATSGSYNEPTGFGNVLRKIVFKIMIAPPSVVGGVITTSIALSNVKFANTVPATIPCDVINGTFNYSFVPPALSTITAGSHTSTSVGEVFGLPVTISGVDAFWKTADVYFELTYNTTLLKALSVTEGGFFSSFGTTTFTSDISTPGLVKAEVVLTSLAHAGVYPSGSGTLATISLNSTYGVVGVVVGPSPLHLQNVVVKDISSTSIGYKALVDGAYSIAVPSPARKAIGVYPAVTTVYDEGLVFMVDVRVYNVTQADKLFGVQFSLHYDPTLLELVSVTEGPFLGSFPVHAPPATYFFLYPHTGYFTVATGLLDGGMISPGYIYPNVPTPGGLSDGGTVAHVTFESLAGVPGTTVTSTLHLDGIIFGDVNAKPIYNPGGTPPDTRDGTYQIALPKAYIDVYTQYPAPYGGQMRGQDADAYAPQDLVILYAKVTYNRFPVGNKLVEFEIHSPHDDIILYRTAYTDNTTGIATASFRLDWPGGVSPAQAQAMIFGTWTVYASVDLDQVTIFDTLHFKVGWLVQVTSVATVFPVYNHLNIMTIDITYQSISAQVRPVTFTVTIYDDAGYGLGSMTFSTTAGGGPIMGVTTGSYEFVGFVIPYEARSGTGTVYADAYTKLPTMGGVPYCPEVSTTFIINAA
jgi:hypothetical protein